MDVCVFSLLAFASAKAAGTAEQRAACTPDAVRLCSAEIPNIARVTSCMRANRAKLSARCRLAFDNASPTRVHHGASHRKTIVAYAHHHLARHHHWTRSSEALSTAQEVIAGIEMACQNQSIPAEFCEISHRFVQSGMAERFTSSDIGESFTTPDIAGRYMTPKMMEGLIQ